MMNRELNEEEDIMNNSIDLNQLEPVARPLLPIFFVLDTSGSMTGQPISMLNHAMEETGEILKSFAVSNPDALLKIGVLQVHSGCQWLQPKGLEELEDFVYSPMSAGGMTDMGAALMELNKKLSRNEFLVSTTGRCKPIIIFMTDGQPTDDWESSLRQIESGNKWYKNSIKIGFAVGDNADYRILSEIVGNPEAVIQTSDLATFNILLQKIAINSAMIGSKSHVAGDVPQGKDIVHDTMQQVGQGNNATPAVTASSLGVYSQAQKTDVDDWDDDGGWD